MFHCIRTGLIFKNTIRFIRAHYGKHHRGAHETSSERIGLRVDRIKVRAGEIEHLNVGPLKASLLSFLRAIQLSIIINASFISLSIGHCNVVLALS